MKIIHDGVEFSPEDVKLLQELYDKAVINEEPSFEFHGTIVVTAFVKYLLEHLYNQPMFMELKPI